MQRGLSCPRVMGTESALPGQWAAARWRPGLHRLPHPRSLSVPTGSLAARAVTRQQVPGKGRSLEASRSGKRRVGWGPVTWALPSLLSVPAGG